MPVVQRRERAELEDLENQLIDTAAHVAGSAAAVSGTAKDVASAGQGRRNRRFYAVNSLAEVERASGDAPEPPLTTPKTPRTAPQFYATRAQNSANYSHAQTDNAIHANVEATQWAEYLAGPVVNASDARPTLPDHPFGHGLYYQPVEGRRHRRPVVGQMVGAICPAAGRPLELLLSGILAVSAGAGRHQPADRRQGAEPVRARQLLL